MFLSSTIACELTRVGFFGRVALFDDTEQVRDARVDEKDLLTIKTKLAVLSGDVEKLQAKRVDGVETTSLLVSCILILISRDPKLSPLFPEFLWIDSLFGDDAMHAPCSTTGQSDARTARKRANQRCEELIVRIQTLHKECLSKIGRNAFVGATSPSSSPTSQTRAAPSALQQAPKISRPGGFSINRGLSEPSVQTLLTLDQLHLAVDEAEEEYLELRLRLLYACFLFSCSSLWD